MGSVLEMGKITAVSWLYRNWNISTIFLKVTLPITIVGLMLITSMGVFGFLSRSHFDLTTNIATGASSQIELIDIQIQQKKDEITDIDKRVSLIDDSLRKLIDTNKAQTSLKWNDSQRKTRQSLLTERNKTTAEINELLQTKNRMTIEVKKQEVEVGPIKYITQLFFEKDNTETQEKAIRYLIILLTLVFDPLAIILVIAANHGIYLTYPSKDGNILNIHRSLVKKME